MASHPIIALPSAQDLQSALIRFGFTVAGVTAARAAEQEWVSRLAGRLAETIGTQLTESDCETAMKEFQGPSAIALIGLFIEIGFVNLLYRDAVTSPSAPPIDEAITRSLAVEPGDLQAQTAIDDIEIVHGSIEKLLNNLPRWLSRILDVALEVLKLAR